MVKYLAKLSLLRYYIYNNVRLPKYGGVGSKMAEEAHSQAVVLVCDPLYLATTNV